VASGYQSAISKSALRKREKAATEKRLMRWRMARKWWRNKRKKYEREENRINQWRNGESESS